MKWKHDNDKGITIWLHTTVVMSMQIIPVNMAKKNNQLPIKLASKSKTLKILKVWRLNFEDFQNTLKEPF